MAAQLENAVAVMRRELQNLRKQVEQLRRMLEMETGSIKKLLDHSAPREKSESMLPRRAHVTTGALRTSPSLVEALSAAAIGSVRTCFREKNGTPRQPGLVPCARGVVRVEKTERITNPSHWLEGLEEFSHAW